MDISIRDMKAEEASMVHKLGKGSFDFIDNIFIPKPKNALLAIKGEEIVGSASYKIFPAKDSQKIGYVETAFVKKGCEGQGIGNILYKEITDLLKMQGCTTVTAIVKDDNVASWRLFEKNNYHILSFVNLWKEYGLKGSLHLGFEGLMFIAVGYHMWATVKTVKPNQLIQFFIFVLLNIFAFLPRVFHIASLQDFMIQVAAVLVLLVVPVLAGMLVTLFYKGKWEFSVVRGGLFISLIVCAIGGVFPIVGRSFPKQYNYTDKLKFQMAVEALAEWSGALLLVVAGIYLKDQGHIWNFISIFGKSLLLYRSIPIYPFESFGGGRIWGYNKALSILVLFVSLALLVIW